MTELPSAPGRPSGWAVAAIATVLLLLLYVLRLELLPLAFAAAIAYLVHPLVELLRSRLHLPRGLAVLLVYLAVVALFGLAAWWCALSVRDAAAGTFAHGPDLLREAIRTVIGPEIRVFGQTVTPDAVADRLLQGLQGWIAQPSPVFTAGGLMLAGPAALVLMAVTLFYFLLSGRRLAEGVLWLAPPGYRPRLRDHWRRIDPMLRRYTRGILLVVLYTSTAAWLALQFAFHTAFALPIALVVGVLEVVPIVGPAASMVLLGSVGLMNGDGLMHLALLVGFAVALRVSIDALVGPIVLGDAVTLHPVVVIVAFLVATRLYGVLGVLFAVPVAAAIKIVLQVVYREAPV